jgi:hypothetical protein
MHLAGRLTDRERSWCENWRQAMLLIDELARKVEHLASGERPLYRKIVRRDEHGQITSINEERVIPGEQRGAGAEAH